VRGTHTARAAIVISGIYRTVPEASSKASPAV
jgi:hypothetical protein